MHLRPVVGRGTNSVTAVVARIQDIPALEVDDGIRFDAGAVRGEQITAEAAYVGVRVVFPADLGGMALKMQIDVGFGDAVVPDPHWIEHPQVLELGQPRLLGYPPETTLPENRHAMVNISLANSRMKDDYDLWAAQRLGIATAERLANALPHTFDRREAASGRSYPKVSRRLSRTTWRSGRNGWDSYGSRALPHRASSRSWHR